MILSAAVAIAALVVVVVSRDPAEDWWTGPLWVGSVLLAAPALGGLGLSGRRDLLVAAGIVSLGLTIISIVALPLGIAGGLFLAAAARTSGRVDWRATVVAVAGVATAFFVGLVHEDPRSWHTSTSGGWASDVIVPWEALAGAALVATAIAAAWHLGRRAPRTVLRTNPTTGA